MALDVQYGDKNDRSGSDLTDGGELTFDASRPFTVTATGSDVGKTALLVRKELQAAGTLPLEGFPHPDSDAHFVRRVILDKFSPTYYIGREEYRTLPTQSDGNPIGDDVAPWDQPTVITRRSVPSDIPVEFDFNDVLIANPGTNEPVFGVTRRFSDLKVSLKRAFRNFNATAFDTYRDTTNADVFLGRAAGTGLFYDYSADGPNFYDGEEFFNVTAEILFRTAYVTTPDKAWFHRRPLVGFYEKLVLGAPFNVEVIVRARDDEGREVTQPIRLDEQGFRLDDSDPTVYVETQLYGTSNFSSMGF